MQAKRNKTFKFNSTWALLGSYLVIIIVFSIASPYFLKLKNFISILKFAATMGIVATGITYVIIAGSLEISVGSTAALAGCIGALVIQSTQSALLGVTGCLLTGVVCGCINASLIVFGRINPFITTMATQNIFRGIAYILTSGYPVVIRNKAFNDIAQMNILGIPLSVVYFLVIFFVMGYILRNTMFGRHVYSIGGNSDASYLSGINVKVTRFGIYMLVSVVGAISGLITASMTGTGSPSASEDIAMDAIASAILGGTALSGGKGTLFGTFIGVLLYSTLNNGMILMNIPSFYQMVLKGIILILAVLIDVFKGSGGYK